MRAYKLFSFTPPPKKTSSTAVYFHSAPFHCAHKWFSSIYKVYMGLWKFLFKLSFVWLCESAAVGLDFICNTNIMLTNTPHILKDEVCSAALTRENLQPFSHFAQVGLTVGWQQNKKKQNRTQNRDKDEIVKTKRFASRLHPLHI